MTPVRVLFLVVLMMMFTLNREGHTQDHDLLRQVEETMLRATTYMVEEVSTNGGYVDRYLPDFSKRWGELEAFDTQITIRTYGRGSTSGMGHLFLNAWHAIGNDYYLEAADKVARALIWGQLTTGGWDYIIDFAGPRSLKHWYNTIGQNAWGWFEYNNYYGTATHKQVTTEATRFLLRYYLETLDPTVKEALDKTVEFFLESQYPLGGWPQRYPHRYDHWYEDRPGYTPFYTFSNVGVIWENIEFLIMCYVTLGEERLLDPIRRGMNFYVITQQGNPQGGWAVTYDLDLTPTYARPFEPESISTLQTYYNSMLMLRFYKYTGDLKFLARNPDAFEWIRSTVLPEELKVGDRIYPTFVEIGTNRPLFNHREGTGVLDGRYWTDYSDKDMYGFGVQISLDVEHLEREYELVSALSPEEATANSPLCRGQRTVDPLKPVSLKFYDLNRSYYGEIEGFAPDFQLGRFRYLTEVPDETRVWEILDELDELGRWFITGEIVSDPYTVDDEGRPSNTALHSDPISAYAISDQSDQLYISMQMFAENMNLLMRYLHNR